MNSIAEQKRICQERGAPWTPSPDNFKVGIARNVQEKLVPLNGLRHPPEADTTGWYIWAGEDFSEHPDFFVPVHVAHLAEWCPEALQFLGLPPGWRFLKAGDYEDVWYDEKLLNT